MTGALDSGEEPTENHIGATYTLSFEPRWQEGAVKQSDQILLKVT